MAIRQRIHRWRRQRFHDRQKRRLDEASKGTWECDRCGLKQESEGRYIRRYVESPGWKADFVAMSCWACGAPMIRIVKP